jgi:hypothetical protein
MAMYSSVQPLSQRPDGTYRPSDTIDFVLDFAGREIDPKSIRISGVLNVTQNDIVVDGTSNIFLDPKVGAHGLFQQYITSLPDAGLVLENFQNVPRWVAMSEVAKNTKIGTGSTLSHVIELKAPGNLQSKAMLGMVGDKVCTFSFKPVCALTNSTGNISYSKTGTIKLSCLMSSVTQFLQGSDVNNTTNFTISNLQLDYMSAPDTQGPVSMMTVSSLKQTLTSSNQQLSLTVPATSSALTMSFVYISRENILTENYTRLEVVPDVTRVEFSFNDIVSGSMITYALENNEEIVLNALKSMDSEGKYDLVQSEIDTLSGYKTNYLIGSLFGNVAVAKNTRIGVNIQSSVQAGTSMACYLYFKGMISL